jgi:DNA-binding NarL/FixJ family response regulator
MNAIRKALIADDHSLYRCGLSRLLADQLSFGKVFEADSFANATALLSEHPDVELALFDLQMPGMQGPQSLADIRRMYPNLRVAIVAASESKTDVLAAVATGLSGFIPKSLPNAEIIEALQAIVGGRIYVPGLMMQQEHSIDAEECPVPTWSSVSSSIARSKEHLTPRQKDVFDCLSAGMTNREIAQHLAISIGTVKGHVGALLSLLHVRNRMQLAMRDGRTDISNDRTSRAFD